jgi:NADPH-dependent curcumin reductase CurA
MLNQQVILTSRPEGIPQAANFEIVESPIAMVDGGHLLVRNLYLSVEPAMRGWVNAAANYAEPVPLGSVMRSFATGRVIESRHPRFKPGDFVTGVFGWQEYAVVSADSVIRTITDRDVPLSTSLGVLGLTGLTAYVGLLEIGRPRPGDTVVVSTAAGSVGSIVGQIAKLNGCRTVGIAGGAAKVAICVDEFRFDAAVDYKSGDFDDRLTAACPAGVDVYFDNTAGAISDSVIRRLNIGARVVICGTASIATWEPPPLGPHCTPTIAPIQALDPTAPAPILSRHIIQVRDSNVRKGAGENQ